MNSWFSVLVNGLSFIILIIDFDAQVVPDAAS